MLEVNFREDRLAEVQLSNALRHQGRCTLPDSPTADRGSLLSLPPPPQSRRLLMALKAVCHSRDSLLGKQRTKCEALRPVPANGHQDGKDGGQAGE
jgi:hypothetical protein